MTASLAEKILEHVDGQSSELLALLERLVGIESPSDVPESQERALDLIAGFLSDLDFACERLQGEQSAGCLLARRSRTAVSNRNQRHADQAPAQAGNVRAAPARPSTQLLLGHCDTVWPRGTVATMPVARDEGRLRGPGVYDMKSGLVQMLFALRTLSELELEPPLEPVVLVNTDEELGSRESRDAILDAARRARRCFVMEPSLGLQGRLKTARKGVGRYTVVVTGKAAHAGLDPQAGASAIVELAEVIQQLFALNDLAAGTTVNVGMIEGGLRPNVIAPQSKAVVDVRVLTTDEAERVDRAIRDLQPKNPLTRLEITGGIGRPPMEPRERNRALWELARGLGTQLGLELEEATAGGGSDGNLASQFTPTLDGLGGVGDGAHATHEFVFIEELPRRTALLAMLLMAPDINREEPSA